MSDAVVFSLDGREIEALPGETILLAARRHGVDIPHLCYQDGLRAEGNCRACMVEIAGERVLAAGLLPHAPAEHGGARRQRTGALGAEDGPGTAQGRRA